jgi:predicted RNA polymerase sigma factor
MIGRVSSQFGLLFVVFSLVIKLRGFHPFHAKKRGLLPRCGHKQDARNLFVFQVNPLFVDKKDKLQRWG